MKFGLKYCSMKKLLFVFISMLSFKATAQQKLQILATASMWQDMCKVISGNLVDCDVIVPIGSDPHLYEPTPADLLKVSRADAILINGLTFEGWLSKLIINSGTKAKQIIITTGVQAIESEYFHNATDPHAWMSAQNGILYATNIYHALAELDPIHEAEYRFNYGLYIKELKELDSYIHDKIQSIPAEKRVLITSHDGFRYFGNQYGLTLEPLQGTSTESDVQSTTLLHVNQVIQQKKIPAIFIESTINPKLIQQIQSENKIEIGGKLFADSLGDSLSRAQTYIEMLKYDADVIHTGLIKSMDATSHKSIKSAGLIIYLGIGLFYLICFTAIYLINRKE